MILTTAFSILATAAAAQTPPPELPPGLSIPLFLLGFVAGGFAMGFLALVMHRRLTETLAREQAGRLASARRKAYGQGYEHRAALEFAAREEGA